MSKVRGAFLLDRAMLSVNVNENAGALKGQLDITGK